jgi:hypothetical protein
MESPRLHAKELELLLGKRMEELWSLHPTKLCFVLVRIGLAYYCSMSKRKCRMASASPFAVELAPVSSCLI